MFYSQRKVWIWTLKKQKGISSIYCTILLFFFPLNIFLYQVSHLPLLPSQKIFQQISGRRQCHPSSSTCTTWQCSEQVWNTLRWVKPWKDYYKTNCKHWRQWWMRLSYRQWQRASEADVKMYKSFPCISVQSGRIYQQHLWYIEWWTWLWQNSPQSETVNWTQGVHHK